MSKRSQRLAFFDRAAEALVITGALEERAYLCPICPRPFPREAADAGDRLTLEHVPPASQGGRAITLTCRHCNSHLGGPTSAASQARDEAEQTLGILQGHLAETPGRVRVKLGPHVLNAQVKRTGDVTSIELVASANDPAALEGGQESFKEVAGGEAPANLTLPFQVRPAFDPHLAEVDALRTAYLAAFAKFGYSFIVAPAFDRVRAQLVSPNERILAGYVVSGHDSGPPAFTLVQTTAPLRCLMVLLAKNAVVLPWPGQPDPYPLLDDMRSHGPSGNWTGRCIPWPGGMEMWLDYRRSAN